MSEEVFIRVIFWRTFGEAYFEEDQKHQYLGTIETSVAELVGKASEYMLRKNDPSFVLKDGEETTGEIFVLSATVSNGKPDPLYLDFEDQKELVAAIEKARRTRK
ncbi:MAG: hypothetical protein ACPG4J_09970, partial [Lentibacter algarum]